jgi:hypothetical protein
MAIGITGANNGYSRKVADERFIQTAGGTVTGNLTVTGTLSTTLLEALSANITVIDIKQYELSGFSVQGDCTIQGNVSASGSVTANNLVYKGGNTEGAALTIGTNDAQQLTFETNNSSRMIITSAGAVGFGVTSFQSGFTYNQKSYRKTENIGTKLYDITLGKVEFLNMALEQLPRFAEFISTVDKSNNNIITNKKINSLITLDATKKANDVFSYSSLLKGMYNALGNVSPEHSKRITEIIQGGNLTTGEAVLNKRAQAIKLEIKTLTDKNASLIAQAEAAPTAKIRGNIKFSIRKNL